MLALRAALAVGEVSAEEGVDAAGDRLGHRRDQVAGAAVFFEQLSVSAVFKFDLVADDFAVRKNILQIAGGTALGAFVNEVEFKVHGAGF